MADGKCRKVLQFNEYDFRHKQALEILSRHPRGMTELVVNALLHYVSCPEVGLEYSPEGIRKIVLEVLQEVQSSGGALSARMPPSGREESGMAASDLSELGDVMSMFRKHG